MVHLSRNSLKWIALVAMMCDHFGAVFSMLYSFQLFTEESMIWFILRLVIGRLAFPIFCVLFLDGFFRISKQRRLRHVVELFVFAVISEFAFDMASSVTWMKTDGCLLEWSHQNVMFSWLLGFLLLWLLDAMETTTDYFSKDVVWLIQCITVFLFGILASYLKLDYRMACMMALGIGYLVRKVLPNIPWFVIGIIVCILDVVFYGFESSMVLFGCTVVVVV